MFKCFWTKTACNRLKYSDKDLTAEVFVVDASYFSIAHLQTMSNQANGETRHDNLRRLQDQKRTVEMQLSQKAQELLQLRLVGLEAETKWLPFL